MIDRKNFDMICNPKKNLKTEHPSVVYPELAEEKNGNLTSRQ